MYSDALTLLFVIFTLSFTLGLAIYVFGGRLSVKGGGEKGAKSVPYACGENPPEEARINLERFFVFAVYFLIFDVFAFMIAVSSSAYWILPLFYSLITLMAIATYLIAGRNM